MLRKTLFAATLALAPLAAQAQDIEPIVIASDPETFISYFEEEGYPVRLTEDGVGDPLVEFRAYGEKYSLFSMIARITRIASRSSSTLATTLRKLSACG